MSQYNESYYNGAGSGGGGGGGYLAGGSPFSASGSPGGLRKTEISHSLRPFTVAQLNKATQAHTDAEWRVDDVEIGQATIVGQVSLIQSQATNCVYAIDDGTGQIEARHWIDSSSDEDAQKWAGIKEKLYVRVTGGLKSFGTKRYINTTHMRVVTDPHEVYFHILEAISVSLIVERGAPTSQAQSSQSKGKDVVMSNVSAYTTQSPSGNRTDEYSHLPPLQRSIIRFMMTQPPTDEGIHVSAIVKALGSGNDAHKINDALDKLMDEGHVYTTTDDSHFILSA